VSVLASEFQGGARRGWSHGLDIDSEAGVYRYDELIVLHRTSMPAVLLEAGSIDNRQEELELGTPERHSLTSAAVVAAVENFCAARARPPGVRAAASGIAMM
jgi:hypothetical protein